MKLSPRDARAFFKNPDANVAGLLIFGEDAMRVALRRKEVTLAMVGPEGEGEMRLTRLAAAEVRRDKAALVDAIKAQGFFPGRRAVVVDDASDQVTPQLTAALEDWQPGDAQIVATAGNLTTRSSLRKLFENNSNARSAAIYNDPPGRDEIEAELRKAGLTNLGNGALSALEDFARVLGPGDFRQMIEKIGLYKHNDTTPLSEEEIALNAPATIEAQVDEVFHMLAEGQTGRLAELMQKIAGQGVTPVTLLILAMRHFRMLYTLSSAPGGPSSAAQRMRPPLFGLRKDRIVRQASRWRVDALEQTLSDLMDADLSLRSAGQNAPAFALVERCFVRVAYRGSVQS